MVNAPPPSYSPLLEFTRRIIHSGGISMKGVLLLPLYYIQLVFAIPFRFFQFVTFHHRIRKSQVSHDPIFILGHYRSGTTLLQKLLASDKRFGCLTNYDALFPNSNLLLGRAGKKLIQYLINVFKIRNPFFHNSIVSLNEPAEEDDFLMNKASPFSAYWGLIFPKRWRQWLNETHKFSDSNYCSCWEGEYLHLLKYASFRNKDRQLVLKSPPNTGRVEILLRLFPNARFIFIHRNPYEVYYSTINMWKNAILKHYSLQRISDADLSEIVFGHFSQLIDQYLSVREKIPKGNLVEISFEELTADAVGTVGRIYKELQLPEFESTVDDLLKQLDQERNYQNFEHHFDSETLSRIGERWGKYISLWNYDLEHKQEATG